MPKKQESDEPMMSFTFRLPKDLLESLKDRAGLIPVSVVLRKLIEMYINGEVKIKND